LLEFLGSGRVAGAYRLCPVSRENIMEKGKMLFILNTDVRK
jgi:hypothetical protein